MDRSGSPLSANGDSALHVAVRHGRIANVWQCLNQGNVQSFINHKNFNQETALHLSCARDYMDIMHLLIAFGADLYGGDKTTAYMDENSVLTLVTDILHDDTWLNCGASLNSDTTYRRMIQKSSVQSRDDCEFKKLDNSVDSTSHETLLHIACELGQVDMIHMLISRCGKDIVNLRDRFNSAPIHRALCQGFVHIVKMLLDRYMCDPMIRGYQQRTLLHYACGAGNTELVNLLIQTYNLKINAYDASKLTPLHIAAMCGQENVLELLITSYDCQPDCTNVRNQTPLLFACKRNNDRIIQILTSETNASKQLFRAVQYGHTHVVATLSKKPSFNPQIVGFKGRTLLHQACIYGNIDLVELLISEFHLNPLCFDKNQCTPFHYAALHGRIDILTLLISKYNCRVEFSHKEKNETVLHLACVRGHLNVVEMLVRVYKVDIGAQQFEGETPVHLAVRGGHVAIAKLLLSLNSDLRHARDYQQRTVLHKACENGNVDMVNMLVSEYACDPFCVDKHENTLIHVAAAHGHTQIIKLLVKEYNLSAECMNLSRQTPLHMACSKGNYTVCCQLLSEFHVNCNALDVESNTPLNELIKSNNTKVVHEFSTQYGCRASILDYSSKPLLHQLCRGQCNLMIQELLLQYKFPDCPDDDNGNSLLHTAALLGNSELVQFLISKFAKTLRRGADSAVEDKDDTTCLQQEPSCEYTCDINARNNDDKTPLHVACGAGNVIVVKILASHDRVDLYAHDGCGNTPLHCAVEGGHCEVVKTLICEFDCRPECCSRIGLSLLHCACKHDHIDMVVMLTSKFGFMPETVDNLGNTSLHHAAFCGQENILKLLIAISKDAIQCVFSVNDMKALPLHLACFQGNVNIVTFLIDIMRRNRKYFFENHTSESNHSDCFLMHLVTDKGSNLLHYACSGGHVKLAQMLMSEFGLCPTSRDYVGNTSLHYASIHGQEEIAELILTKHISLINDKNNKGETALHLACSKGHSDFCSFLISQYRAKLYLKDNDGNTPLVVALMHNEAKTVHNLAEAYDCCIDVEFKSLSCPLLHQVCARGYNRALWSLINDFGHDPFLLDCEGNTILHVASKYGQYEIVKSLIECYRERLIDTINAKSQTSLHLASIGNHANIVHFLIVREADIYVKDSIGETALRKAHDLSHGSVISAILSKFAIISDTIDYRVMLQLCKYGHTTLLNSLLSESINCDGGNTTVLHVAASYGDESIVRMVIADHKYPINLIDSNGQTALHIACSKCNIGLCNVLISEFNADITIVDNAGDTPLNKAIKCGDSEVVHELATRYNCKASFITDQGSYSLLHHICGGGYGKVLQQLIVKYAVYNPKSVDSNGNTLVHIAALYGRCNMISELILRKCPLSCQNIYGNTPLHCACLNGHADAANLLVRLNSDIAVKNKDGLTPFQLAHKLRKTNVTSSMLHALGYDGNDVDSYLIHQICMQGKIRLMDQFLSDFHLDPLSLINDTGDSLIHTAARFSKVEMLKHLTSKFKLPINVKNKKNGQTAVHTACRNKLIDLDFICKLIRELGADGNVVDNNGDTPLNVAIRYSICDTKTVHILTNTHGFKAAFENCKSDSLLHQLCAGGYAKMLLRLVSRYYYDPALVDEDGNTVLHIAIMFQRDSIARVLIDKHSHKIIDSANKRGQTALHCACSRGFTNIAKQLVSHKANITIKDNQGNSPLKSALLNGNRTTVYDIVREFGYSFFEVDSDLLHRIVHVELLDVLLFDLNVDPTSMQESKCGNNLLHTSVTNGHIEIIHLLLSKYSFPVDAINSHGQTSLHLVCSRTPVDAALKVLTLLVINYGADLNPRDNDGNEPIVLAARTGRTTLVEFFVKQGIDPSQVKDINNRTLLHIACAEGHVSTTRLLIEDYRLHLHTADDDGNSPLHLSSLYGKSDTLKLLLDHNVPEFIRNKSGKTAANLASASPIKQIFQSYKQNERSKLRKQYTDLLVSSRKKYSGEQPVTRVFVVGNSGSGKSTLVESFRRLLDRRKGTFAILNEFFTEYVTETDVPPCTSGIVPSPLYSKLAGIQLFYDFAGHKEYYSSHAAILEQISRSSLGSSVYFIVANMCKESKDIQREISYWLSFISHDAGAVNSQQKLKVVIVLSHKDKVQESKVQSVIRDTKNFLSDHAQEVSKDIFDIEEVFPTNCCDVLLCRRVETILKGIASNTAPCGLSLDDALLHGILENEFNGVVTCKFKDLIIYIESNNIQLPKTCKLLYPVVKKLHDIGELMIIGRSEGSLEDCLLLLDMSALTNKAHELLFSESAKQKLADKTNEQYASMGILPEDYLQSILPEYITKECLIQLQYCQEFSLAEVSLDYSVVPSDSSTDTLLYFPALCTLTSEQSKWPKDVALVYSLGWYGKSKGKFDCFPPRFLHILLLRLAFKFALPVASSHMNDVLNSVLAHNRRCTMWSNGIRWLVNEGVECVVEVVNDNKGVVCIVRSREKHAYDCIHMLTLLVDEVVNTKAEFCHSISLQSYFMNADTPAAYSDDNGLYDIDEIWTGLKNNSNTAVSISGSQNIVLEDLKSIECHTHWDFYFPIKMSSILHYIEEVVVEWEAFGMALSMPYSVVCEINLDKLSIESKRTELIRRWMNTPKKSGPACWLLLVKALEEPSVNMNVVATKIRSDKENDIRLQEKLLEPQYSGQKPDSAFIRSFADIVSNRWPSLASLLNFTTREIEEIRQAEKQHHITSQALCMLKKWATRDEATYGKLNEKLKVIPLLT